MNDTALLQGFLGAIGPEVARCVDTSTMARALYSSDASLYRVVPQAVALPHDGAELEAVLAGARSVGLPVTARGAGTSCAGNAVGEGLVIDMRRHMNHIWSIDPERQIAEVDPGVIQDVLQRATRPFGLRFGPDPSTSTRCTLGGIVANNACGPRALGYGVAATNLVDAEVITGAGDRLRLGALVGEKASGHSISAAVSEVIDATLAPVRTQFGRFSRQVSGYGLQHLLPERGRDLVRFFAGSEGTLGVATRLTLNLVKDPAHTLTVALGYSTMDEAADHVTALLDYSPIAVEGMDSRLVHVVRRTQGPSAVPSLPRGDGWTFVELGGDDPAELNARATRLIRAADCLDGWAVKDPAQAAALWKIRSDGAGLAGVSLDQPAYPGWEDAAVPAEKLGEYLRGFESLLADFGLHALPYGHFGEGCVHARIDFPLTKPGGLARYRSFVTQCARLVTSLGGSLSGEHGDGRARSELLPIMYSAEAINLFGAVKHIFDPDNLLNPGVIAEPAPLDAHIRYGSLVDNPLVARHPSFSDHVHRCTGVGKCVAAHPSAIMCPSYQATHEEQNSARGRARILQELVNGTLIGGWNSPEVASALDLCLACKGCSLDCPTNTDIASAKSYVLHQRFKHKPRPRGHYVLGWLPRWGRLATRLRLGGLINTALAAPGLGRVAKWIAGVDQRRPLPRFASRSARDLARRTLAESSAGKPVVVWVDSFTDSFEGTALPALIKVLLAAGYSPRFLERTACCGLTWITTGQRDRAAQLIRDALDQLAPIAESGTPILGMEPSCLAVWRSDASELVDDPRVRVVAEATCTLAELLGRDVSWTAPDLRGHEIVAQPHCHHAAVLGWQADADLLERTGATVTTVGGCCGLAGNFGVEIGHHDTSVAVAENQLLPTLRAHPAAIVLADGFSCRKQVLDLTDRQAMTLAEILAVHIA
ncbi:MAG: FAD-binding oxidoreductase [Propionibacteriaceae bacterium]|nr:FAD-binding oxidoreductase [Propionibacteriaceae bacterium]